MDLLIDIDDVIKSMTDLNPSMYVLAKADKLSKDPDTLLDDLAETIAKDSALSANIMRLSNSAYFSVGRPTGNVMEAVKCIGFKGVIDIIATFAVKSFQPRSLNFYGTNDLQFWTESLSTAVLAESIADATALKSGTEYTLGILSTIGKLVINDALTNAECESVYDESYPLIEWEESVVGCNHAYVGARILEEWGFLPDFVNALEYQFKPRELEGDNQAAWILHITKHIIQLSGPELDSTKINSDVTLSEFYAVFDLQESAVIEAIEVAKKRFSDLKEEFFNLH